MSSSYNHVTLMGNLTRDPDLRQTNSGKAVVSFTMALNHHYTSGSGEKKEEATFVEVVFWGKAAEVCARYLHQGSPALVDGRLQMDQWEDKQTGQKRSKLRVVGENLKLLEGKPLRGEDGSSEMEDGEGEE